MADRILVTLGLKCPRPLFEVSKAIRDMRAEETLEVAADDPAFTMDIEAWCHRTGHRLLDFRKEPDRLVAVIEKKKDETAEQKGPQ